VELDVHEKSERRSRNAERSGGLLYPPLARRQIFEQHNSSTTFENHFNALPRDRLAPPFIIDAPDFTYSLDGPTHLASCIAHPDRQSISGKLHLHPVWNVECPKPVRIVPRSAFRVPISAFVHGSKSISAYRRSGRRDHGCTSMT